eukprot:CAMPEP_0168371462 /NCGR_PEP_ID=MMETSP0228-20121227/7786_1 /TAXON_ID=133427 /ORGANISM="Protoceratium reticulatum, Strain CCCM 535 (=CCMP 1889)" /LENGTH=222 /DNA_ID=CAMNT_0008384355 /DNA_START=13 /DNA_END=679 /DNA_ORIENTATION=-
MAPRLAAGWLLFAVAAEGRLLHRGLNQAAARSVTNELKPLRQSQDHGHAEVPFRKDGNLTMLASGNRDDIVVDLEVPNSLDSFMQGLMYRSSFCETCSMIFAWNTDGDRPFWMKDTWIPLDMVWVNREQVIVDIKQAQANDKHTVRNDHPATYVFEFRENWCADHGVRVGDKVAWDTMPATRLSLPGEDIAVTSPICQDVSPSCGYHRKHAGCDGGWTLRAP